VLHRARLDAVRGAAAVDGQAIDPWHLATILEGLCLRMDPYLSMLDRDAIFDAARHAFDQYQWLVTPNFDQEGEIQAVETALAGERPAPRHPLPAAAAYMPGSSAAASGSRPDTPLATSRHFQGAPSARRFRMQWYRVIWWPIVRD
jgi:hypothetical protein